MIALSIRRSLFDPGSEVDLVTGITIPDWDDLEGVSLLRSVDYYEDSAFNYHLLEKLLEEVDGWLAYERGRSDSEDRCGTIAAVREALAGAYSRRQYAVFLSL